MYTPAHGLVWCYQLTPHLTSPPPLSHPPPPSSYHPPPPSPLLTSPSPSSYHPPLIPPTFTGVPQPLPLPVHLLSVPPPPESQQEETRDPLHRQRRGGGALSLWRIHIRVTVVSRQRRQISIPWELCLGAEMDGAHSEGDRVRT